MEVAAQCRRVCQGQMDIGSIIQANNMYVQAQFNILCSQTKKLASCGNTLHCRLVSELIPPRDLPGDDLIIPFPNFGTAQENHKRLTFNVFDW